MTRLPIDQLKALFETGDRPTGGDYSNLIDTLIQQSTDLGTAGNNENTITGIENMTVIDYFTASQWRMIKYLISVSKNIDGVNKYYATELTILIDGESLNITQYGVIDNDGDIGTVDVSRESGTVFLKFVPNPLVKPVTVRYARMGLKA